MARHSFQSAMATQAGNGHVLGYTVWNHFFRPETDELHPMGITQLNRLVRRSWREPLQLYVETAHDLRFDPGAPADYAKDRDELDARRMQAISTYLSVVANRNDVNLFVHDPPRAGMSSDEAWRGDKDMVHGAPRGYLTAEAIAKGAISSEAPGGFPITLQPDLGGAGMAFPQPPNFGGDIPVGDFGGDFGGEFDVPPGF
ncbi:MAG: hypothetical protein KDA42_18515 [Planctomycetales bacterium]|nr:hypothetical protein [Planctomycetales bacterium]